MHCEPGGTLAERFFDTLTARRGKEVGRTRPTGGVFFYAAGVSTAADNSFRETWVLTFATPSPTPGAFPTTSGTVSLVSCKRRSTKGRPGPSGSEGRCPRPLLCPAPAVRTPTPPAPASVYPLPVRGLSSAVALLPVGRPFPTPPFASPWGAPSAPFPRRASLPPPPSRGGRAQTGPTS